jgi:8-oxo-dGTP pyrophosphatase MutT (NUDIX family)
MTLDGAFDVARDLLVPLAVATLAAIGLGILRRWKRFADHRVLAPARKVARRTGSQPLCAEIGKLLLDRDSSLSGAAIWERLSVARGADPLALSGAIAQVRRLLEALEKPDGHGLIASLLYRDQIGAMRDRVRAAIGAAEPFERLDPLTRLTEPQLELGGWVTAVVGTPILADSLDARARVGGRVRVWSSSEYVGQGQTSTTYEQVHQSGCEAWAQGRRKAGDYDGRVMVVRSCTTFEDRATGELTFVVQTVESCYASTEQGGVRPWGCKHLPLVGTDVPPDIAFVNQASLTAKGQIQPILTSFASVMTSDKKLLLCRRSKAVNSGAGLISATGGGVFEPGDAGRRPIDRDACGWPDPALSVCRELSEELGLDVRRGQLKPACVFLANSRNTLRDAEGQLVVCSLYLGRVDGDLDAVKSGLWSRANLATGRFEVDDLIAIDVGTIELFENDLKRLEEPLDQHALLSCIYTAHLLWGDDDDTNRRVRKFFSSYPRPALVGEPQQLLPDRYVISA